ncbi:hypothetical protein HY030_02010 [Candidatus Gottesmanbacteria bacterium]|nr:hypothetical protein [Candidatus Gottesmanbacteria bacterium]
MFLLFFLYSFLLGLIFLSFFPKTLPFLVKISLVYLLGTLFLTVIFFLAYPLLPLSSWFLYLPFLLLFPIFFYYQKTIWQILKELISSITEITDLLILLLLSFFSSFLFFKTIWFDAKSGQTLIAGKLWSDFGAHIPLIKSFFTGFNFPPEYPLFPGEPIRYHFLFDFQVALLEKLGLPLSFAINIPSILSFTVFLLLIYSLGVLVFKKKSIGVIAVILTLFNSSFAFLNIFKKIPLSPEALAKGDYLAALKMWFTQIIQSKELLAFGPYDRGIITAFWNLNVYTNQRHFAFALGLIFLIVYILLFRHSGDPAEGGGLQNQRSNRFWTSPSIPRFSGPRGQNDVKAIYSKMSFLLLGLTIGLLPMVHSGVFLIAILSFPIFIFLIPKYFTRPPKPWRRRDSLIPLFLTSFLLAFPQILYFQSGGSFVSEAKIHFQPFFYNFGGHSVVDFFRFWLFNFGLTPFLALLGFFLADKKARFLFLFLLLPFLLGNFISFSPDLNTNHKFFNFVVIILNIYAAYFISKTTGPASARLAGGVFFEKSEKNPRTRLTLSPVFAIILLFFLTISGFLDFFPAVNDSYFGLPDLRQKKDISWIENNTPKQAIFANSFWLYHPASLAGRKIVLGWPYFSWSAGYDTTSRDQKQRQLYLANDTIKVCEMVKELKVDFVTISTEIKDEATNFNLDFWQKKFPLVYENPETGFYIFNVGSCHSGLSRI